MIDYWKEFADDEQEDDSVCRNGNACDHPGCPEHVDPEVSGKCGYLPSSGRDIAFCYAAALISLMGLFFPTTPNASGIVVSPANRAKATPAALR